MLQSTGSQRVRHKLVTEQQQMAMNFTKENHCSVLVLGLPWWLSGKESTCQCRGRWRRGFNPWVGKIPWSRKWQPIPFFLPGKLHGQRSLESYSPWGHEELDITERAHTYIKLFFHCKSSSFKFLCTSLIQSMNRNNKNINI